MDEMGITIVRKTNRVVVRGGFKQIKRITFAKRGSFVTVAYSVSGNDHSTLTDVFTEKKENTTMKIQSGVGPSYIRMTTKIHGYLFS